MIAEIALTWGPGVEIPVIVREAGQRQEPPDGERRGHPGAEFAQQSRRDATISVGKGILTQ
ncbi:MAG: hypothetical protein HOY71_04975 [Nonomuraea sp.]|nr:hypothetical protein [Nonomuraea sp.]